MFDAHFCSLEAQSNIYGLCKIGLPCKPAEILVASLRGKNGPKVISLKISNTKPLSKEIRFTYIPGDAEIISIDAFNKSHHESNVVVGITFIKTLDGKSHYYLNIYSEWAQNQVFDLDSVAQGYYNTELSFVPYQLTHAEFVHDGNVETVFLLTGSDHNVHVFREDRFTQLFTEETNLEKCFPEMENLHGSSVTWLEMKYFCDYQRRLSAMGFLDGSVRVAEVNTRTTSVIKAWDVQHDSPITSVKIFTLKTDVECPHFVTEVMDSLDDTMDCCYPDLHLLVTSALEVAVIYRSILEKGFSEPMLLPGSEKFDSVLCACTADVDMDGQHEILLGTYGQEMLVYKFVPEDEGNILFSAENHFSEEDTGKASRQISSNSITNAQLDSPQPSKDSVSQSPKCPFDHKIDSESNITGTGSRKGSNEHIDTPNEQRPESEQDTCSLIDSKPQCETDSHHTTKDIRMDSQMVDSNISGICALSIDTGNSVANSIKQSESKDKLTLKLESLVHKDSKEDIRHFSRLHTGSLDNGTYELMWQKSFAEPVFAIDSMDLMGDGLEELVILTLKGLHVLQHEPEKATRLCLERLKLATRHQDAFKLLQSEDLDCQNDSSEAESAT